MNEERSPSCTTIDEGRAAGLDGLWQTGQLFRAAMAALERAISRQREQARSSTPNRLIDWLGAHVPADDGRVALVHGDWRIDNMIFAADAPRLLAVLDWELSTLGHPFADLAYQCMQWRLPNGGGRRRFSRPCRRRPRRARRSPAKQATSPLTAGEAGSRTIPDWTFLIAFSFFRIAAIAQGVYKRSLDGNASDPERARKMGAAVPLMAKLAMEEVEGTG